MAGAIADQHDVGSFFHDAAGGGDGMKDSLDGRDASGVVIGTMHDTGILLDDSGSVWKSADADGAVFFIGFDQPDPLLDGVEERAVFGKGFEGLLVAGFPEGPCGNDERGGRLGVGAERLDGGAHGETGGEEVAAGVKHFIGGWSGGVFRGRVRELDRPRQQ